MIQILILYNLIRIYYIPVSMNSIPSITGLSIYFQVKLANRENSPLLIITLNSLSASCAPVFERGENLLQNGIYYTFSLS